MQTFLTVRDIVRHYRVSWSTCLKKIRSGEWQPSGVIERTRSRGDASVPGPDKYGRDCRSRSAECGMEIENPKSEIRNRRRVYLFTGAEPFLKALKPRGCGHCHQCGCPLARSWRWKPSKPLSEQSVVEYCGQCKSYPTYLQHGSDGWHGEGGTDSPCPFPTQKPARLHNYW